MTPYIVVDEVVQLRSKLDTGRSTASIVNGVSTEMNELVWLAHQLCKNVTVYGDPRP